MNVICLNCQTGCCFSMIFENAKKILSEVTMFNPEGMALMERIPRPNDQNKTVCAFLGQNGCSLEEGERPECCILEQIH